MHWQDVIPNCVNSFELFGFDVLVDEDLRPWLIEVNSSPSLARDNALVHQVPGSSLSPFPPLSSPPLPPPPPHPSSSPTLHPPPTLS